MNLANFKNPYNTSVTGGGSGKAIQFTNFVACTAATAGTIYVTPGSWSTDTATITIKGCDTAASSYNTTIVWTAGQ